MKNSLLSFLTIALITLLSPPLTAAEWTDFPLATGARAVYVSSSEGNDSNDGLTVATPKRTITGTRSPTPNNPNNVIPGGFSVVRNGMGDQLLLRRGDTFAETAYFVWNKSGLSTAYPALLAAYGTGPRPVIERFDDVGLSISPVTGPTVRYLAVTGIHFRASKRDWNSPNFVSVQGRPAIVIAAGMNPVYPIVEDVLIEDCRIEFHAGGISMTGVQLGAIRNIRINRNVISDIYAVAHAYTTAIYASNVTGLTLTENLIDGVQRTAMAAGVPEVDDTPFCHSVYVQSDSRDVVLEQNIIANAFDGGMMRPGGRYAGNVAMHTSLGTHHGYMFNMSAPIITEGVESTIIGNAFLGPFQYGIQIGNLRQGFAGGNIMLSSGRPDSAGFNLIGRTDQDTADRQFGLKNLTIFNNYVLGTAGLTAAGPEIVNVTVDRNDFCSPASPPPPGTPVRIVSLMDYEAGDFHCTGNRYHSDNPPNQWFRVQTGVQTTNYDLAGWKAFIPEADATEVPAFTDPVPSVASYNASIGGTASETAFLAAARQQSRASWDNRYMAAPVFIYLRMRLNFFP
jgi:hypothetical protein